MPPISYVLQGQSGHAIMALPDRSEPYRQKLLPTGCSLTLTYILPHIYKTTTEVVALQVKKGNYFGARIA
jgi:hypothetical protein